MSPDEITELQRQERRLCDLEAFARAVSAHIYESSGVIIEAPDGEGYESDDEDN